MPSATARLSFVRKYLDAVFSEDLHAKRVGSLAGATLGVMLTGSLAVAIIGQRRWATRLSISIGCATNSTDAPQLPLSHPKQIATPR